MIFSFLSFLIIAQIEPGPARKDLSALDEARLRRSMEEIYGEFGALRPSEWKVAIQGKTEVWTWTGERMECPAQDSIAVDKLNCEDWVPVSFRWFMSGKPWLEPWVSMRRQDFFLGKPELKSATASISPGLEILTDEQAVAEEDSDVEVETVWEGNRLASRVWNWVHRDGQLAKVFVSLRNSYIERIDPDSYSAEYLEWKKANRWAKPQISKLVLDRNGVRVSFEHVQDKKK